MGSDAVYCPRWPLYTICLSFLEITTRVAEGSSNLTSSTPVSSTEAQSSENMQTTTGHEVYFDENLQVDVIQKKKVILIRTTTFRVLTRNDFAFQAYMELPSDDIPTECQSSYLRQALAETDETSLGESPTVSVVATAISTPSPPARPASVLSLGKDLFKPRGQKRQHDRDGALDQALKVMKEIADQPISLPKKDRTDNFLCLSCLCSESIASA